MIKLIQALLKSQRGVDAPTVISVEPFIEDGEQQWEVTVSNPWIEPGQSTEMVSISELLVFMYNEPNNDRI